MVHSSSIAPPSSRLHKNRRYYLRQKAIAIAQRLQSRASLSSALNQIDVNHSIPSSSSSIVGVIDHQLLDEITPVSSSILHQSDLVTIIDHDTQTNFDDNVFDSVSSDSDESEPEDVPREIVDDVFLDRTSQTTWPYSSKQIALLIVSLQSRHTLTKSCCNSVCRLLCLLRVPNAPASYQHMRRLILDRYCSTTIATKTIVCPSCHCFSVFDDRCSNIDCSSESKFNRTPTTNFTFALAPQIRSVLTRHHDKLLIPSSDPNSISDIVDGPYYRKIYAIEPSEFVSLHMNSDGVVIKSSLKSIWITAFVLNELPRTIRFRPDNVVLGMISTGSMKPKKDEMQLMLGSLVEQLLELETDGVDFFIDSDPFSSKTRQSGEKNKKVFLISSVCDKPAATLLINHIDPVGYFRCTRCTIKGESVQTGGGGYTRVYPHQSDGENEQRSNDTYDKAICCFQLSLDRRRRVSLNSINNSLMGLKGPCALRALRHFDVYRSVLSDTLHNLYSGAVSKMYHLWFDPCSAKSGISSAMSIRGHLDQIAACFKFHTYPSSTYRIPSDIRNFPKYKANEFRMSILHGYKAFKDILDEDRYDHYRLLAFATHLIESSQYTTDTHKQIQELLLKFDKDFVRLYTKNHVTPVIHSILHFADSAKDFGPAFNYSAFPFESTMASLAGTIHGGSHHTEELINNVDLLRQTYLALAEDSIPLGIQAFVEQLYSNAHYELPRYPGSERNKMYRLARQITSPSLSIASLISEIAPMRPYQLFKTLFINSLRISADPYENSPRTSDACVMFEHHLHDVHIGFVEGIVWFADKNEIHVVLRDIILTSTCDELDLDDEIMYCTNVLTGYPHQSQLSAVRPSQIIQKLKFDKDSSTIDSFNFYQYPNLLEST